MYYILYQITNKLNSKIYVGVHKTKDLEDGYMGSGKVIKAAIAKHGIENFEKKILKTFNNADDMFAAEAALVTEEFLAREDVYNLRRGGTGGFDYINSNGKNIYGKNGHQGFGEQNLSLGWFRSPSIEERTAQSIEMKRKYSSGELTNPFLGKNHSPETKRIISEKSSIHQAGSRNSQYGTVWIIHEIFGKKKIDGNLLPEYIEQGWFKGGAFRYCPQKKVREKDQTTVKQFTEWYNIYNLVGFVEFCRRTGYDKSQQNLVKSFSRYVEDFKPQNGKRRGK